MIDREPKTSRELVAQISCDLHDLHALLILCATGSEDEESSRVMNAGAVLTRIIQDRAAIVWNQLDDPTSRA